MESTDWFAAVVIIIMAVDAILDNLFDILGNSCENYKSNPRIFHWHFCAGAHNLGLAIVAWMYWGISMEDFDETLGVEKAETIAAESLNQDVIDEMTYPA